jgi:CRISPR-associated DxTHG motif protein
MNQPKPRVLVSFIGKGQSGGSSSGYRTTQYTFPDGWQSYELSVFGIALLTYYEAAPAPDPVDKMAGAGQPAVELGRAAGSSSRRPMGQCPESGLRKNSRRREAEEQSPCATGIGQLTQPLLDEWGDALSERLRPMVVKCQLVGWCEAPTSQLQMWRVLSQEVPEGSELVLDTTHGFRHQPMLLAPMVVLLGMLKNLSGVELYYGALDMDKRVLKLDLFPELLEYIQHVSVLQTSGDYEPLSETLIEESQTRHQLREIAFLERVNHPVDYEDVQRLMETIDLSISSSNPLKSDLLNTLQETLRKHLISSDLERMVARADVAKDHRDYLVAYTLLYEAIITIAMQRLDPSLLQGALPYDELRSSAFKQLCRDLGTEDSAALNAFRKVRNSMVHANPVSDDERDSERAEEALQSEQGVIDLYDEVRQIFAKLRDMLST